MYAGHKGVAGIYAGGAGGAALNKADRRQTRSRGQTCAAVPTMPASRCYVGLCCLKISASGTYKFAEYYLILRMDYALGTLTGG